MKVKSESEVAQSCPTLHDLMDCSLPGSSAHGIFQARVLEWGAIAFSDIGEPKYIKPILTEIQGERHKNTITIGDFNGEGNGTPLQYSCLVNPMDRGAWWAAVHGVAEGQT